MAEVTVKPEPLRDDLRIAIQALSTTVQALTQATQVLMTTSERMIQAVQCWVARPFVIRGRVLAGLSPR